MGCGVHPEVADDKRLEEQPVEAQITEQPPWSRTEGRNGQRRVDEVPFRRRAQPGPRAETDRPCRLVLQDEQALECVEVGAHGFPVERVLAPRVCGERGQRRLGRRVSSQGHQQPADPGRVPPTATGGDVSAANLVEVVAHELLRVRQSGVVDAGPAAAAGVLDQLREGRVAGRCRHRIPCQQAPERHGPARSAALEQRHRTHEDPGDATGAGVAGGVVGWHGRAREDEAARSAPGVARPAHVVPDRRHGLPLVQQPGLGPLEQEFRTHGRHAARIGIDVEQDFACGLALSGGGLAAGARPLDDYGGDRPQPIRQRGVHDSWPVGHRRCLRLECRTHAGSVGRVTFQLRC